MTPDDHVNIGFHEILIHDMEEEELPFRLRKECKERFGCMQSGNCTNCGKYIQRELGKHIAQTVWKGTAQDCIYHMRRTHNVPLSVKAANLARLFPPWTVTREQWAAMNMPSISGMAIDTLLF